LQKKFGQYLKSSYFCIRQLTLFFQNKATLAQLVEQLICNQPVGGSSPSSGSQKQAIICLLFLFWLSIIKNGQIK
jgi:hypothetical protein